MRFRRPAQAILAASLIAGVIGTVPSNAAATITTVTLTSKAPDAIKIVASLFKPEGASAATPVPMVFHSHGWGGSRSTSGLTDWTNAGFGMLSIDQRGHGASGGQANVEDPNLEGKDIETWVDYVAGLDWVAKDAPTSAAGTADPVLFAIGGSYGGGYQTIGALTEVKNYGATRFNALAPEITWYDLPESLGPQGVVRTLWVTALYAAGATFVPNYVHEGYAVGAATGWFPDGTIPGTFNLKAEFYKHSPRWFADNGFNLDIPVLIGQGSTDNLFNLNQGIHNFLDVVTPAAQKQSLFVGYNGGHVLPEAYPLSNPGSGDKCSGGFAALTRNFFKKILAAEDTQVLLPKRFNITNNAATACLSTSSVTNYTSFSPEAGVVATAAAVAGAPLQFKIAEGPLTITGIPLLSGHVTNSVDARAFFGLSVGTTPADALLQQNNVMPMRRLLPGALEDFEIELPGVGISLAAGQSLYLTVTPTASHFVGFGSRAPGAIVITDAVVKLPLAL